MKHSDRLAVLELFLCGPSHRAVPCVCVFNAQTPPVQCIFTPPRVPICEGKSPRLAARLTEPRGHGW